MNARLLFNVSAAAEALVGIALLIAPADVIRLLLGGGTSRTGSSVGRLLGIGLISLGVSVFEMARQEPHHTTRAGICTYNLGAGVLLSILGALGASHGILLWPAAALHGLIGATMLWVMLAPTKSPPSGESH